MLYIIGSLSFTSLLNIVLSFLIIHPNSNKSAYNLDCLEVPDACTLIDYEELQDLFEITAYSKCRKEQIYNDVDSLTKCFSCMETEFGEDFFIEITILCSNYLENQNGELLSELLETNEEFQQTTDFDAAIYLTTRLKFDRLIIKDSPIILIIDSQGFSQSQLNELGLLYLEKLLE